MRAALPEGLCRSVHEFMSSSHAVPSRATLYRHRGTMLLAWYRILQRSSSELLQRGGMLKWYLVDSSPQGHLDWVLSSSQTLPLNKARLAYLAATKLKTSSLSDEECLELQATLSPWLLPKAGPAAIGSGRAGTSHKVHAFAHAAKLECQSWEDCAAMLSNVVCFTTGHRKPLHRVQADRFKDLESLARGHSW